MLLPVYLSGHNFPQGSESREGLVTPRRAGSQHPVSGSGYLGQSLGISIITSSQVTLMLLGQGPHFRTTALSHAASCHPSANVFILLQMG